MSQGRKSFGSRQTARWSWGKFDAIAETSQFADHLARPHLLRLRADGGPGTFLITAIAKRSVAYVEEMLTCVLIASRSENRYIATSTGGPPSTRKRTIPRWRTAIGLAARALLRATFQEQPEPRHPHVSSSH